MGCSQNDGPLLIIDYITAPNIYGNKNGTLIWGTTQISTQEPSSCGLWIPPSDFLSSDSVYTLLYYSCFHFIFNYSYIIPIFRFIYTPYYTIVVSFYFPLFLYNPNIQVYIDTLLYYSCFHFIFHYSYIIPIFRFIYTPYYTIVVSIVFSITLNPKP